MNYALPDCYLTSGRAGLRILLVLPPFPGNRRYGKLAKAGSYLPPLGLLYLAAMVRKEHSVRVMDGGIDAVTVENILREVNNWKPHILV